MKLEVDLFWSFRSPYSYLIVERIVNMQREYDIEVNFRPVYPIAIRDPEFFSRMDPLWMRYLEHDVLRQAEFLGVECTGWPNPDPVQQDLNTLEISSNQPHISRLTRLGVEAARRGKGIEFMNEVSKLLFASGKKWTEGRNLENAIKRTGLDLADLDATLSGNESSYEEEIEANQQALNDSGHWGVPTLVFKGEPFFGQDRLEVLLWRLKNHGLTKRKSKTLA